MVPAARQRVRISERPGVYFVLEVDRESGFATVINVCGPPFVEEIQLDRILSVDGAPEDRKPLAVD